MQVEQPERPSDSLFVGRQHEIEQLVGAFVEAASGRPRLALLVGEPGIGKTSTAQEFAERAGSEGALVLWGSCYEGEGAPAYWPWLQILRRLVRELGQEGLVDANGPEAHALAHLLPELSDGHEHPDEPSIPPEQARFRLFDAVASLLRTASAPRAVVLILDDLHWADEPSLLVLEFLARELTDARVMIVATYRQEHLGRQHPLAQVLGRMTMARRLVLAGLGRQEVERFIELAAGVAPTPSLVDEVHVMTAGNPFFLGEVVRLLSSEGRFTEIPGAGSRSISIPQGVREVIGRRLGQVSPECNRVLVAASVVGREFGLNILERVCDLARDDLLELLAEAVRAGVIEEIRGTAGRFAFAHALVRETLYSEPTTIQRIRLHRAVGEALEELYGAANDEHIAEIAHHFLEAAPGGDAERAIRYATRAAERAGRLLAYEEAVRFYGAALEAMELGPGDGATRCDLLFGLGDAQWSSGDEDPGWSSFMRAAEIARDIGDAERLGRAALGPGAVVVMFGLDIGFGAMSEQQTRILEESIEALPGEDSPLRARLLARLAAMLYWTPEAERRSALASEAIEMARRLDDKDSLAYALSASHWSTWVPENSSERLATVQEIIRLARELGNLQLETLGHLFHLVDLVEIGEIARADAELEMVARAANELRDPSFLWFVAMIRAMRLQMSGDIDEAERLATAAFELGQQEGSTWPITSYWVQMCCIRVDQDRGAEIEPTIRSVAEQSDALPAFRTSLAYVCSQIGKEDEARRELELMSRDRFAIFPKDAAWLAAVASMAEVSSLLGDAERAAELYELLLPFEERFILLGPASVCLGSAHRYLGGLAATLGRFDDAERHFEESCTRNGRAGDVTSVAETQLDWAGMLLARDESGDRERATDLLGRALVTARDLGRVKMVRAIESLVGPAPVSAAAPEPGRGVIRREGQFWTLGYGGEVFRLKDTKGLKYIAELLSRPGAEVHVMDLVASTEGAAAPAADAAIKKQIATGELSVAADHAGDVLDAQAKQEYRRRLEELREELEEANDFNDPERAARAQWEIDAIADQLAAGVGLGGRSRKAASVSERARVNVRNSITSSLRTIQRHDEALWRHLSNSIKTGTFCSYAPEQPTEWEL